MFYVLPTWWQDSTASATRRSNKQRRSSSTFKWVFFYLWLQFSVGSRMFVTAGVTYQLLPYSGVVTRDRRPQ